MSGDKPLPYLSTQYVDLAHYIDVNYKAYEQEYWYDLRSDMCEHVQRTQPRAVEGGVEFGGWSRYITPSVQFKVDKVSEVKTSEVQ